MKIAYAIAAAAIAAVLASAFVAYADTNPVNPVPAVTVTDQHAADPSGGAPVMCHQGTKPIMIDGNVHCKVLSATGPACPANHVLIQDGNKPVSCAGGAQSIFGDVPDPSSHMLPGATPTESFSGGKPPAHAPFANWHGPASPQGGKASCPTGFTLTTRNGSPICKGETKLVCDKEQLMHLIPADAFNKRWDSQACVWHYSLAD